MRTIVDQLARLRAADGQRRIFGASGHRHELNPPVEPAALDAAERLVGARLPSDYRRFLLEAGDGGAGPYYGVKPLTAAVTLVEQRWGAAVLGADSPLTGDVDFGALLGKPDSPQEHVARLEADPEYEAGFDRLRETYLGRPWCCGRLPLADYGCGDWLFLVVRGPRRGTVWVDSVAGATGLYCLEVDFLTWYRRWLDDAVDRAERGDFAPVDARYSFLRFGDNPRYQPRYQPPVSVPVPAAPADPVIRPGDGLRRAAGGGHA